MKKLLLIVYVFLMSLSANAQDKIGITEQDYQNSKVEMADQFRSEGKIYVLTGIILIILLGTTTYLVMIDRKVGRLEKELHKKRE